jgi:hypothetical protein
MLGIRTRALSVAGCLVLAAATQTVATSATLDDRYPCPTYFDYPVELAAAPDGGLIVGLASDFDNYGGLRRYSPTGGLVFITATVGIPTGVAVDDRRRLVAALNMGRLTERPLGKVSILDLEGDKLDEWPIAMLPADLAISHEREIAVVGHSYEGAEGAPKVLRFAADGRLMADLVLGANPRSVAFDSAGRLYVLSATGVEQISARITSYSQDGQYIDSWEVDVGAVDIAVGPDDSLYLAIVDQSSGREPSYGSIGRYATNGTLLSMWGVFGNPTAMDVTSDSEIYAMVSRAFMPCPHLVLVDRYRDNGQIDSRFWLFGHPGFIFLPRLCAGCWH